MSFVVVRVWVSRIKKGSPGHASLALKPRARKPEEGYISFAPVEGTSPGSAISGCEGKFYDLDHDLETYVRATDDGVRGAWVGAIYGLDIEKMLKHFWQDHERAHIYKWSNECATLVHRYLKLGGGDKYASRWSRNVIGTWSPDDVEDYAKSIIKKTADLGSRGFQIKGAGTIF